MKPIGWARSHRTGAALALGTAGTLVLLGAAAPASGSTARHSPGKVAVPQGSGAAALKGAGVFGSTPPDTPETVSFVLRARNLSQLESSVEASMPDGYLSVSQFAQRYGQSRSNIVALEHYLAHYGISTSAYADGLDVTATGTAGEFDHALSVKQHQYRLKAVHRKNGIGSRPAMTIHGTTQSPLLPANLASFVLSVLGLTSYPTYASTAVHVPAHAAHESTTVRPAAKATPSTVQTGSLIPADFASQYNLDPLYGKGANGKGETIGIITLASVNPSDPEYFWNSVLNIKTKPNRITLDNIDGGSGAVSANAGSDETSLDVEQSGALAPDANIVVYQAPNTDYGFVDGFYAAASQNVADTVSASWEESETAIAAAVHSGEEDTNYAISFDDAMLELAAQGQSSFVAAGDYGAYDPIADQGSTNLGIANPQDSPWTTSAGGTTLPGTIPLTSTVSATIAAQRVWSWDWLWPYYADFGASSEAAFAESEPIGGGGGFSTIESTPSYQQLVPRAHHFSATEYFTPTDFQATDGLYLPTNWNFNPDPLVTTGWGNGRATPDVSADADPWTGYLLYFSGFSGDPLEAGWGGTSFVAPQLNGATAVIDSYLGHRVGFWNPQIYQFATQHNSPFTPYDRSSNSNDDLYYTGTPGQVYNVGSGLGSPNLAELAYDFGRSG